MRNKTWINKNIAAASPNPGFAAHCLRPNALHFAKPGALTQIIIYKGEAVGTGVGLTAFKLTVGEEMTVTAKGVETEGNDLPIWPTWKADKELSINVVEGKSKMAVAKALKEGAPVFITAIYVTDDEK